MKLENGYTKLAEMMGLEVGQEFNLVSSKGLAVSFFNPYRITECGIVDVEGDFVDVGLIGYMVDGQIKCEPIVEPLLTKEEKAFVKSVSDIIGLPVHKVCRVPYFFKEDYYFLRIDCQGGGGQTRSTFELHHGGYENLVPDVEYTPKELGLEN